MVAGMLPSGGRRLFMLLTWRGREKTWRPSAATTYPLQAYTPGGITALHHQVTTTTVAAFAAATLFLSCQRIPV